MCLWMGPRPHVLKLIHVLREWRIDDIFFSGYENTVSPFPRLKIQGTEK